ncbi:MAG: single-stranded DNA-binding protein [bacterium]
MSSLKMPDINNVLIAGNLTNDPTLRRTTNGTPVANFYIASNRKFRDNTGQWRENVCFVGVVAWYKLADSCYEHLRKGSAVLVEGELQSRSWTTSEGNHNNVVEIKARRIQFLNRQTRSDTEISQVDQTSTNDLAFDSVEVLNDSTDTDELESTNYGFDLEDITLEIKE